MTVEPSDAPDLAAAAAHGNKANSKYDSNSNGLMLTAPVDAKFTVPPTPNLTDTQRAALGEFRSREPWLHVPPLPAATEPETADIVPHVQHGIREGYPRSQWTAEERDDPNTFWLLHFQQFCSDDCLLRYLRAHNWQVERAMESLIKTLEWRRTFRPHLVRADEVEKESLTGKIYLNGFDKQGRPVLYLRNHRQNSTDYDKQIRFTVFNLEQAIQRMPPGVEKVCLVFDFKQFHAASSPPMFVSRYFLYLFANHYPGKLDPYRANFMAHADVQTMCCAERLGALFACDAPWYFWTFYKLMSPFIHPVTKAKIRFVDTKTMHQVRPDQESAGIWSNLLNHIDADVLEKSFGGRNTYEYDHATYWPLFCQSNPFLDGS